MRKIVMTQILLLAATALWAVKVSGVVTDATTNEPLIGASVFFKSTMLGVATDTDGVFSLEATEGDKLTISYVGYENVELQINENNPKFDVQLQQSVTALNDVLVTSQIAIQRKTPVAATTVDSRFICERIGNQDFPEILFATPSVYVNKNGGGRGDSQIMMRGFQSNNIAVMINGVPMNDMETSKLYWSNWDGLSDVTTFMQTQRGLGAAKLSAPSVGGSINIVTKSTEMKQGGSVAYMIGNDRYNKVSFSLASGLLKKGWAFSIAGSRTWGDGYIQGTDFVSWSWFVNVSKIFNDRHSLSFTGFGAPQWHNQGGSALTEQEWRKAAVFMKDDSPYKYNQTYGFDKNGQRCSSNRNEYHKPQLSLNHNWTIDGKSSLSTVLYTSIGRGYGYTGLTTANYVDEWDGVIGGVISTLFRNDNGTFAYNKIQDLNAKSTDGSQLVMAKKTNDHIWGGLVTTYTRRLPANIDFYAGVDTRFFKGIRSIQIVDLYDGEYFIDRFRRNVLPTLNSAATNPDFINQKLSAGDVANYDYDSYVAQEGFFTQFEGTFGNLTAFVSGSISNVSYWRYDRFYYEAEQARSKTLNFYGGTVKCGANYNVGQFNNLFFNAGYISRAPFLSDGAFWSLQRSNTANQNAVNEKIVSIEFGYGFRYEKYVNIRLNAYYTLLMDKTHNMTISYSGSNGNSEFYILNFLGENERHAGVELELKAHPTDWLEITGMLSVGDWRWISNPDAFFYNIYGQPIRYENKLIASGEKAPDHAHTQFNLKGTPVSGSAQTTAALGLMFKPLKGLRIGTNVNIFDRYYANRVIYKKNFENRSETNFVDTWKIPVAAVWDANISYKFTIYKSLQATISGSVKNILNQKYISDAWEWSSDNVSTQYKYSNGFGRTWSCSLKIQF